jgi:LPS export ABC transporter protein LptC
MRRGIVLLLFVTAVIGGCEEKLKPSVVAVGQAELPDQESWRSKVIFSDSARVKAILWAGHISVYSRQQTTVMDDSIHVDFFNDREQHTSVLTARRGKVDDRTRDFAAYDHVLVVSDSGTTLKTDSLFWKNATRTIETDAAVEIISPKEHIKGQGLVSDQGLKNYRIFKVTGQAVLKER